MGGAAADAGAATTAHALSMSARAAARRNRRSEKVLDIFRRAGRVPATENVGAVPGDTHPLNGVSLALGELRRLARLVQSGLLALDLAGVPREVALALEGDAKLRIQVDERTGDTVPHRTRLAGEPAAVHAHAQVVLALEAGGAQRRDRERPPHRPREVLVQRAPVHPGGAVAGPQNDAGDGGLALAGAAVLSDLAQITSPVPKAWGSAGRADAPGLRRSSTS